MSSKGRSKTEANRVDSHEPTGKDAGVPKLDRTPFDMLQREERRQAAPRDMTGQLLLKADALSAGTRPVYN